MTKDNAYNLFKPSQKIKDIILLSGDKDSSVVILNKVSDKEKINRLINDGINKGVYIIKKNGNWLAELKLFKISSIGILRNVKNDTYLRSASYIFCYSEDINLQINIKHININNLKLWFNSRQNWYLIIQICMPRYLQPLAITKYAISDTLSYPDILWESLLDSSQDYLSYDVDSSNEEYVFYDVDSLFTSISLGGAIDFYSRWNLR